MDRLTQAERLCVVAMAIAADLNDEATIIATVALLAIQKMEPGPERDSLIDGLQASISRCATRTRALLRYGAWRPVAATFDQLTDSTETET